MQQVPGGGGGGAPPQAEEGQCGDPALLPGAHPLPERLAPRLALLLQRRAANERPEGTAALLRGSVADTLARTHMHACTQLNTSVCVADPLCVCVCVKQETTGLTAATGTPPCCPTRATASTTRQSARPMG